MIASTYPGPFSRARAKSKIHERRFECNTETPLLFTTPIEPPSNHDFTGTAVRKGRVHRVRRKNGEEQANVYLFIYSSKRAL